MTLNATPEPKDRFWHQVLKYAGLSVAVSGGILGLPVIFPILVIPTTIAIVASWVGGIGTLVVMVAKQSIDEDTKPPLN